MPTPTPQIAEWVAILYELQKRGGFPEMEPEKLISRARRLAAREAAIGRLRASGEQHLPPFSRPPGDYCAACASRWCVCPDQTAKTA